MHKSSVPFTGKNVDSSSITSCSRNGDTSTMSIRVESRVIKRVQSRVIKRVQSRRSFITFESITDGVTLSVVLVVKHCGAKQVYRLLLVER